MPALTWTTELALNQPQMDTTHREFVDLLAQCAAALATSDAQLLANWETLCAHTAQHFEQEDRWMVDTGLAPENCHSYQHQAVLNVMLECAKRAREQADFDPLRVAVGELATWFPQHARMMDAALAEHMASLGYDPVTGECRQAVDSDGQPITGCGGSGCA